MNDYRKNLGGQRKPFYVTAFLYATILGFLFAGAVHAKGLDKALTLPDLSGMAWIEGDLFLGVHDAKRNPKKYNWPRVSLVRLPKSELEGVSWQQLDLKFPGPEGRSSDMESACRIPGSNGFLFAESGQEGEHDRRIFYAEYDKGQLQIQSYMVWPVTISNVEATEVYQVGGQLIFMYAERAPGLPSTQLKWANLSLNPLSIGTFKEVTYTGVDSVGKGARPIVALDVDSNGFIYIVSAYDTGNDNGPFRSVVWRIGRVASDKSGKPTILLNENKRLATLDGLKVESITIRKAEDGSEQIYVGTDDEHFGGIIRLIQGSD